MRKKQLFDWINNQEFPQHYPIRILKLLRDDGVDVDTLIETGKVIPIKRIPIA